MIDRRVPGQSQLDYLWTNFGPYAVSNVVSDDNIPTTKFVTDLINTIQFDAISSLQVINGYLVGFNQSNEEVFRIDVTEITTNGKSITNFGKRYITEEDVNNGISLPLDSPVYYIRFSDGTELVSQIDTYQGFETDTAVITINDQGQISSNVKLDNEGTVVTLSASTKGIKADIKVVNNEGGIQLTKELEGLKAQIILSNPDKILKFKYLTQQSYSELTNVDETTVYFIEGKQYFYFGNHQIGGSGSVDLSEYYTKAEVDNKLNSVTNIVWKDV